MQEAQAECANPDSASTKDNDMRRAFSLTMQAQNTIHEMQRTRQHRALHVFTVAACVIWLGCTALFYANIPLGIATGVLLAGAILARVLLAASNIPASQKDNPTNTALVRRRERFRTLYEVVTAALALGAMVAMATPAADVLALAPSSMIGVALGCGVLTYLALYYCDRPKIRNATQVIAENIQLLDIDDELTSPVPSLSLRQETGAPAAAVSGKVSDAEPSLGLGAALLST